MPQKLPLHVIGKSFSKLVVSFIFSTAPKSIGVIIGGTIWLYLPILIRFTFGYAIRAADTVLVNPKTAKLKAQPLTEDYSIIPESMPIFSFYKTLKDGSGFAYMGEGFLLMAFYLILYLAISMLRWSIQSELERFAEKGTTLQKFLGVDTLEEELNKEEHLEILRIIQEKNKSKRDHIKLLAQYIYAQYYSEKDEPQAPVDDYTIYDLAFEFTKKIATRFKLNPSDFQLVFDYQATNLAIRNALVSSGAMHRSVERLSSRLFDPTLPHASDRGHTLLKFKLVDAVEVIYRDLYELQQVPGMLNIPDALNGNIHEKVSLEKRIQKIMSRLDARFADRLRNTTDDELALELPDPMLILSFDDYENTNTLDLSSLGVPNTLNSDETKISVPPKYILPSGVAGRLEVRAGCTVRISTGQFSHDSYRAFTDVLINNGLLQDENPRRAVQIIPDNNNRENIDMINFLHANMQQNQNQDANNIAQGIFRNQNQNQNQNQAANNAVNPNDLLPGRFRPEDFVEEEEAFELDDFRDVLKFFGFFDLPLLVRHFMLCLIVGVGLNAVIIVGPYIAGGCCFVALGFIFIGGTELNFYYGNLLGDAVLGLLYGFLGKNFNNQYFLGLSQHYWNEYSTRQIAFTYLWKFLKYSYSPSSKGLFLGGVYVFVGLGAVVIIGYYMAYYAPRMTRTTEGRRAELVVIQNLRLIGLVVKVIVITGIELFMFPVMCGILMCVALLPLSPNATVKDLLEFTVSWPFLSPFIYWVMGTAHMFQFAFFLSMCRDIMRAGVLYFVRDPNDPNIHPIGDVMERGLVSQLGKIGISGLIYSQLILICVGGVIWSFRYVLDFFFIPLTFDLFNPILNLWDYSTLWVLSVFPLITTVQYLHPSAIIRKLWTGVFHRACHLLRLSSFILDKPVSKELGTVHYGSLKAWLLDVQPDYTSPKKLEDLKNIPSDAAYFVPDGVFVRAPNTDNVAFKKSANFFIPVTKDDERIDGTVEDEEKDIQQYVVVYCPPNFRWRVGGLLSIIWLFAGLGVFSVTGLPIIVGRIILQAVFFVSQEDIKKNIILCWLVGLTPSLIGIMIIDNYTQFKAEVARIRDNFSYRTIIDPAYLFLRFGLLYSYVIIFFAGSFFFEPLEAVLQYCFGTDPAQIPSVVKAMLELCRTFGALIVPFYMNFLALAFVSDKVPILSHNVMTMRGVGTDNPFILTSSEKYVGPAVLVSHMVFLLVSYGARLVLRLTGSSSKFWNYIAENPKPFVSVLLFGLLFQVMLKIFVSVMLTSLRDKEYLESFKLQNRVNKKNETEVEN